MTFRTIFRFWLPLAATWLMMAAEGPFLAAVIARMGEAQLNLAAYGVAYAIALVAESPVIMLMSASTALVKDRLHYLRLRSFAQLLCAGTTALTALVLLPPVYGLIAEGVLGLPEDVALLSHSAMLWLLPWPAAIGIRRFYQGVLIADGQTRRVAFSTVLRLGSMGAVAFALFGAEGMEGARLGAMALSGGVTAEALATRWMAGASIARVLAEAGPKEGTLMGYGDLGRYYLPLALTPFIGLCVHPMVTFFLGRSPDPLNSLAVMPVIYALTFVFRALGLSFQEVAIALVGRDLQHYGPIRNFAWGLALATTALLSLIAFTPLSGIWFERVSGLTPELARFAVPPLMAMTIFPALTVLISFQRAVLIVRRLTTPVSLATAIEAGAIFLLLWAFISRGTFSGMMAAALSYVLGRLLAILFLCVPLMRVVGTRSSARVQAEVSI